MVRIGLTGGIGAGKSTVAKILQARSYPVFYSDLAAKILVENDWDIQLKIKSIFGERAYLNGEYNREYIAELAFENQDLLNQLNQIIHPAVREAFDRFVAEQKPNQLVFNEAAILFETGAFSSFDFTILVCAPEELKIERLQQRDKSSISAIKARMRKQWSDEKKRPLADFVIENNEKDSVLLQVDEMLKKIQA